MTKTFSMWKINYTLLSYSRTNTTVEFYTAIADKLFRGIWHTGSGKGGIDLTVGALSKVMIATFRRGSHVQTSLQHHPVYRMP